MEIAHSINLHNVNESWHHEHVADQTNNIISHIAQKVKWTENHRNEKDCHHDNST